MRLITEIENVLGEEDVSRIIYTVVDGRGGYFQNVKRILEFSPECVIFAGKKGAIRVEGANFSLKKYEAGDIALGGNIRTVARCE